MPLHLVVRHSSALPRFLPAQQVTRYASGWDKLLPSVLCLRKDTFCPEFAQQPRVVPDQEEERWQMVSLFTLPTHRGKGVAKSLCSEVFRWLREHKPTYGKPRPKQIRVRIMVKPENTAMVKLYEELRFTHAGKCTLAEALKANGDGELVPVDRGGPKYQERSGLIMATTFERD